MISIDNHFEELKTLKGSFRVNKPSIVCCCEIWMVESSGEDLYVLDIYAKMKFHPGKTRIESVAFYVQYSLTFEIKKLRHWIDLNYIAIRCTNLNNEQINAVCLNNPPLVNKQCFLEHFQVRLEGCQMSNCFLGGDMNIELLEVSAIGKKFLYSLKLNGCYQGMKNLRVLHLTQSHFLIT